MPAKLSQLSRRAFLKLSALVGITAITTDKVAEQSPTNAKAFAAGEDYIPENPLSDIKDGKLSELPQSSAYSEHKLVVAECSAEDITNLTDANYADKVTLDAQFTIDRPAVVITHSSGKTIALVQSESIRIMNEVWDVSASGHTLLLGRAISHSDGYHICKALGNESSLIWVELNYGTNNWRLYTALYGELNNLAPILIDEGSSDFDIPQIDLVQHTLIWTKVPSLTGPSSVEASVVKSYTPQIDTLPRVIWRSPGRILGGITASHNCICFISRIAETVVSYQLIAIDVVTYEIVAKLVLPAIIRPDHAWYNAGEQAFSFSTTDTIVDLAIFGGPASYIQSADNPSHFYIIKKLPSQIPLQMGNWIYIKGTKSVVGYNISSSERIIIPNLENETNFGDMLSGRGSAQQLTIYCIVPTVVDGKSFNDFETVKRGLTRNDAGVLTASQHTVIRVFK